jgi:hypothetical protein
MNFAGVKMCLFAFVLAVLTLFELEALPLLHLEVERIYVDTGSNLYV